MKKKENIIDTAYYIISKCKEGTIGNLRLQALLYLSTKYFEDCYKNFKGYNDTFYNDDRYPAIYMKSDKIHEEFKNWIPMPIQAKEYEITIEDNEFKQKLDEFIEMTKDISTFDILSAVLYYYKKEGGM